MGGHVGFFKLFNGGMDVGDQSFGTTHRAGENKRADRENKRRVIFTVTFPYPELNLVAIKNQLSEKVWRKYSAELKGDYDPTKKLTDQLKALKVKRPKYRLMIGEHKKMLNAILVEHYDNHKKKLKFDEKPDENDSAITLRTAVESDDVPNIKKLLKSASVDKVKDALVYYTTDGKDAPPDVKKQSGIQLLKEYMNMYYSKILVKWGQSIYNVPESIKITATQEFTERGYTVVKGKEYTVGFADADDGTFNIMDAATKGVMLKLEHMFFFDLIVDIDASHRRLTGIERRLLLAGLPVQSQRQTDEERV